MDSHVTGPALVNIAIPFHTTAQSAPVLKSSDAASHTYNGAGAETKSGYSAQSDTVYNRPTKQVFRVRI